MTNQPIPHIFGVRGRKLEQLEEIHADTERTCKLHTDSDPSRQSNPGLFIYLSQVVLHSHCSEVTVKIPKSPHSDACPGYTEGEFSMANSPNLLIFWTVGGNRSTRRKPTQTRGERANSTQTVTQCRESEPGFPEAVRQQC